MSLRPREGSSQQSQLPQKALGMQSLGLVCTVWASGTRWERYCVKSRIENWLMRKPKQHPGALPKKMPTENLGGGGGPTT